MVCLIGGLSGKVGNLWFVIFLVDVILGSGELALVVCLIIGCSDLQRKKGQLCYLILIL